MDKTILESKNCGNLRLHIGLEDPDDLINDLKDNFTILKGI